MEIVSEKKETLWELNKQIDNLGYEIQSISLNIARINLEIKQERDKIMNDDTITSQEKVKKWTEKREELFLKRRKAIDALNKRVNEIRDLREKRRQLWLKKQELKRLLERGT